MSYPENEIVNELKFNDDTETHLLECLLANLATPMAILNVRLRILNEHKRKIQKQLHERYKTGKTFDEYGGSCKIKG